MLIAVEGLPGSGKTTQARLLTDHLNRADTSAVFLPDNLTRVEDPLGRRLLAIFDSGDPFAGHGSVITDTFLAPRSARTPSPHSSPRHSATGPSSS